MAGDLHGVDLLKDLIVLPLLDPAEVDDHVDLGRAVSDGGLGLHALDAAGRVAVGEADDRADGQLAEAIVLLLGDVVRGVIHIGLRDADARAAVFDAVVTDLLDVLPGGGLLEEGMVHMLQNFLNVHCIFFLSVLEGGFCMKISYFIMLSLRCPCRAGEAPYSALP